MTSPTPEGQRVAGEWLPIETAPKDGTNVLLVNYRGNIATGLWQDSEAIEYTGWYLRGGNEPNVFFNSHHGPIGWLPLSILPAPPATSGREGERG